MLTKGVFGLNDAPRLWWTKLRSSLKRLGGRQSKIDPSLFIFEKDGQLEGLLATHVDDLLGVGGEWFNEFVLKALDREFGFGSMEFDDFRHTGKRIRKDMATGEIHVSMPEYVENLEAPRVSKERRSNPEALLTPLEKNQFRKINGSLQWLQFQTRPDLSYGVSVSQGNIEEAKVKHLVKTHELVRQAKEYKDFALTFKSHDLDTGGFVAVSDASLGGHWDDDHGGPVRSQGAFVVMFADTALAHYGRRGRFTVLDWRSRKIKRVVRSSFAAETLSLADANDALQHLRGCLLDVLDGDANLRYWWKEASRWPATLVTDARDCHDHLEKETSAQPAQRSLLFDLAEIRQSINEGHTRIRWTATENMLVDCMTKQLDPAHFVRVLLGGEWSIERDSSLVNARTQKRAKTAAVSPAGSTPTAFAGGGGRVQGNVQTPTSLPLRAQSPQRSQTTGRAGTSTTSGGGARPAAATHP